MKRVTDQGKGKELCMELLARGKKRDRFLRVLGGRVEERRESASRIGKDRDGCMLT